MDIAFTDKVKTIQERKGSREMYATTEWPRDLTDDVRAFIETQRSFYMSTANSAGQPYIQHRGGPSGFLHVLNPRTLAFADFKGNRQYISQGNLEENAKAYLFLMDYSVPQRLKIWGEARVIEGDNALIESLMPRDYRAKPEQAIIFDINMWSMNCRQHIPRRFDAEDVAAAINERDQRIAELEASVAELQGDQGV